MFLLRLYFSSIKISQVIGKVQHKETGQCIGAGILDIGFCDCSGNVPVLVEQVIYGKGHFSTLIFKYLFANTNIPDHVSIIEAAGQTGIELMCQFIAKHEPLDNDPIKLDAGVLAVKFCVAARLQ